MRTGYDTQTRPDLRESLTPQPWLLADDPFPHVWAPSVFTADVYDELADHFGRLTSAEEAGTFRRVTPSYSALSINFEDIREGPLTLFTTEAWHSLLASCFEVPATGDIEGGLHRHPPGSPPGRVHNDFNPGYFPQPGLERPPVRISHRSVCDYKSGTGTVPAVELVRAVAMIFFLGNGRWRPGDGGEVAVYAQDHDGAQRPHTVFAPQDNSLVALACGPTSYHTYLGRNVRYRNTVIMWLHTTREVMAERHDMSRLVRWS